MLYLPLIAALLLLISITLEKYKPLVSEEESNEIWRRVDEEIGKDGWNDDY